MTIQDKLRKIAEDIQKLNQSGEINNSDFEKMFNPVIHFKNELILRKREGEENYKERKRIESENKYFMHDNLRRFFLIDMLRRKTYLESVSIENLNSMVNNINTLISNLNHDMERGNVKIEVQDKHNWSGSNLFQNIILNNVLEIPNPLNGSEKDFKDKLKARWKE